MSDSRRADAIIQARMGSARFPRKVLADLHGQPVIWHLIHRIGQCREIDEIVVATSDQSGDDDLAAYVSNLGIRVVRGSETNVLERLLKAAEESEADIIVRVTGDAPLVDPQSLDDQVSVMVAAHADFCVSEPEVPNINEGFEAFTMAALTKLQIEAGDDPIAKEHTCTYFKKNPGFVQVVYAQVPEELQYRGARISVDTPPDLAFLNLLHERLDVAPGELDIREVVQLLRREPQLTQINAGVVQKTAGAVSRTAIFRCDASAQIGFGHLIRCLALAEVLRDEQSLGITFVTRPSEAASRLISQQRHRHWILDENLDAWDQLEAKVSQDKADVLVLDVRDGVRPPRLESLQRKTGALLVDIDDPEDKRLVCDLLFYPPVPQLDHMDWAGLKGTKHAGWDWLLLRKQFHEAHQRRVAVPLVSQDRPVILVTMGGSDPAGLTLKASAALANVPGCFHVLFVLGGAFCHDEAFEEQLSKVSYSYEILRSVDAMADLMLRVDLAVACFSVTAYELATVGVPSIFLSLTADHYESSLPFVLDGLALSLGVHDQVKGETLTAAISEILVDTPRRLLMSQAALTKTDGLGARRIAQTITNHLTKRI